MVKKFKIEKDTVIRTSVLVLAIINNGLALFGKSPIPIDNDTVVSVISFLFTTGSAIWTWWKNNSFTQKALQADEYLDNLRELERIQKEEDK